MYTYYTGDEEMLTVDEIEMENIDLSLNPAINRLTLPHYKFGKDVFVKVACESKGLLDIPISRFLMGGITIECSTDAGEDVGLGSLATKTVILNIDDYDAFYCRYNFIGEEITLTYLNASNEILNLERYEVINETMSATTINLECEPKSLKYIYRKPKAYTLNSGTLRTFLDKSCDLGTVSRPITVNCYYDYDTTDPMTLNVFGAVDTSSDARPTLGTCLKWVSQILGCRISIWDRYKTQSFFNLTEIKLQEMPILDGGTFIDSAGENPFYWNGDFVDGGTFNPWNDGYNIDIKTDSYLQISDVYTATTSKRGYEITGIEVTMSGNVVSKYDTDPQRPMTKKFRAGDPRGIVIKIADNDLITPNNVWQILLHLSKKFIGKRVYKGTANVGGYPCLDVGDFSAVRTQFSEAGFVIGSYSHKLGGESYIECLANSTTYRPNNTWED